MQIVSKERSIFLARIGVRRGQLDDQFHFFKSIFRLDPKNGLSGCGNCFRLNVGSPSSHWFRNEQPKLCSKQMILQTRINKIISFPIVYCAYAKLTMKKIHVCFVIILVTYYI